MNDNKKARQARAKVEAEARRRKALTSMKVCFIRSEVMRHHHDGLVMEVGDAGGMDAYTNVKSVRFVTYVSYWFAALSAVIERYQELTRKGTLEPDSEIDALMDAAMIDLVKPFRNAVAHCSDHDDQRVLRLLGRPEDVPDWATDVARAFRRYFAREAPDQPE